MNARAVAIALPGAVLLCAACDALAPGEKGVDVAFEMTAGAPTLLQDGSSSTPVECLVTFRAVAGGPAGGVAVWEGGELRWYEGSYRGSPIVVERLSAQEVATLWQREVLRIGEEATVSWPFWSDQPFELEAELRFTNGGSGRERRVVARTGCGIDPAVTDAPPPSVTDLLVDAPEPFQPGDSFTVSYAAIGAAGLWRTTVTLSGAYDAAWVVEEAFEKEASRTVGFQVPPGVTLGIPLNVTVSTVDAVQRKSEAVSTGTPPLADHTPPHVLAVSTGQQLHGYRPAWLVGQYGVGDTLGVLFHSADNHALGRLEYEIGSARGHLPLEGSWMTDWLRVPVAQGWVGRPGLALQVTDASGNIGPRHEAHPDSIRVFPVVSRPTAEWSTEGSVVGAVWDEARDLLYLALEGTSSILVLSAASMSPDRQIPLPGPVGGLDLTPTGDSLIVALSDRASVGIVTLSADSLVEIDLSRMGLHDPGSVLSLPGERALVTARHPDGLRLVEVHLPSSDRTIRYEGLPAESVWNMRLTRNRDRSLVGILSNDSCLIAYRPASDRFGECSASGGGWGTLSANAAGTHFLVGNRIIDATRGGGGQVGWGLQNGGEVSAFSADGGAFYLSDVKGLMKVRVADGRVLERTAIPIVYGTVLPAADGGRILTVGTDLDSWPQRAVVRRVTIR